MDGKVQGGGLKAHATDGQAVEGTHKEVPGAMGAGGHPEITGKEGLEGKGKAHKGGRENGQQGDVGIAQMQQAE